MYNITKSGIFASETGKKPTKENAGETLKYHELCGGIPPPSTKLWSVKKEGKHEAENIDSW